LKPNDLGRKWLQSMKSKRHDVSSGDSQMAPTSGLRAAKKVAEDLGVSQISIWRWARGGRLQIVRIANRPFVTLESLAEFHRAALAGKFESPLAGAALKSAQARVAREGQMDTVNIGEVA
jgi:hypothetical protein